MMKKLMGLVLSAVLMTGALAGCTGTPAENSVTSTPETTPAATETTAPEASSGTEAAWPRTYVDELKREIVLEKKPEKVALLFFRNFEHMFLLEEGPAAATEVNMLDEWASLTPYKEKYHIADIGSMRGPNIEKLLETEPDLIIVFSGLYETYGEELEKIAPVITVAANENNWKGALRGYGEIFGKEEKAESEISRIETLIADSKEQLSDYSDKTFGVIMLGDKQFWAFTTQFVFNEENGLGLNPPENYVDMGTKGEEITLEALAGMNPDYIFVADINGSSTTLEKYLKDLESNSVWNSLDAVKNGNMHALDSSIAAGGPLGIELGVRTIMENLLD